MGLAMAELVAVTKGIMLFLSKITGKILAALSAILVITVITLFCKLDPVTVGLFIRDIRGEGF